jgi:hypothetical protein
MCSKFSSFAPEVLEATLFQNGCLAFKSPASSDLSLKLKSSVMSASFQAWPRGLRTAAIPLHYYQSVCRPLWLLLKKGREVYMIMECLF